MGHTYLVAHYDVPELGGLGYFVKYPSPSSSSMKQDKIKIEEPIKLSSILFILLHTRAWWARVLHKVPEPTKLGYIIVGHQVPCGSGGPLNYYFFFFFYFTIVGQVRRNFFFLIFLFYLYNVLLFEANVCLFIFYFW